MASELQLRDASTMQFNQPNFDLRPKTLQEAMQLADLMAKSEFVPKDYYGKAANIILAVQMGLEVGLSPMQAIQNIAVINGRPCLWGDALLGLVQVSPAYEWIDENESSDTKGVCVVKRRGHPAHRAEFSLEDAKRAGLLGKQGPWQQHTARMLKLRARGFALRDTFADALKGLNVAEEAMGIQPLPSATVEEAKPTLKERLKAQVEGEPRREDGGEPQGPVANSPENSHTPASLDAPAPSHQQVDMQTVFHELIKDAEHAKTIDEANQVLARANEMELSIQQIQLINRQVAARMKALKGK